MENKVKRRNSKQRDIIREALFSGSILHPTAEEVFAVVRRKHCSMSLGTVYRNLNLMSETGEILKISGIDDSDRFDFCIAPHAHFKCESCGKIFDVKVGSHRFKCLENEGYLVDFIKIILRGTCPKCAKKNSTKKKERKG